MASAAEQLAANVNWSAFSKAEELQKRIWFTLGALVIYRLGTFIPLPGIDPVSLARIMEQQTQGLLGMFNMLSGGAVERMAIFALNVMPYISASIILQVMTTVSPTLEKLKKEGEAGRKTINQYTRYLTVALAIVQSWAIARGLESQPGLVINPGIFFEVTTVVTLTGGVMFLMWLGEQITSRGIGNGVSLIIFAGIVANLLQGFVGTLEMARTGSISWFSAIALYALVVAVITFIVFVERAQRRLLVQYPKRQVGNRMFGGDSSHLPLKLNTSGVIPPIFASSLLVLPITVAQFNAANTPEWLSEIILLIQHGQPLYMALYGFLIVFFAFFYTAVVFNPADTADNLKKYGGFIPGIRPGKKTAEYIDYVLTRLTAIGAAYLVIVCLIPEYILAQYGGNLLLLGGTSFLIIVSVTMDTVAQVHSHLLAHQYEGLIKKSRFKGPAGR
ncbi:MAG: preprotein translocase subunit SecY [Alphaproteobacteria bacterium]|jgi:preprotein translocase subunit SecY|nr:preprotein translocase subunit SecY [Alphaproteobacteria bacterium]